MKINIQGEAPTQANQDDAGYDLRAAESVTIQPGFRALIRTGLSMAIPPGYVGMVCSRSGLALKNGVFVLNAPGIIDPQYRGDVGVILFNAENKPFRVEAGDRIAQLLIVKTEHPEFEQADDLGDTERGAGGFGSTGMNCGAA